MKSSISQKSLKSLKYFPQLLLASAISLSALSPSVMADKTIQLNDVLAKAIELKTINAKPLSQYLGQPFPAQAIIPLAQTHLVTTPVSGLIQQIHYVHGPVEKDAVIAEILSPELLNLQKEYLNTLADYQLASIEYKRAQQLNKTGVVSIKRLQETQSTQEKLTQVLDQQKQDLRLMGMNDTSIKTLTQSQTLQPSIIQIKAPLSGELFDLVVKNGQRLEANEPLISIGRIDPIKIETFIPTEKAEQLAEGQAVKVTQGTQTFDAVAEHIANFTDPATQTVEIHIEMPNSQKTTRPGQFLTVQFIFKDPKSVFQAPRSAVSQMNGQDLVFVKTTAGFEPIAIEILSYQGHHMTFKLLEKHDVDGLEVVSQGTTALKALAMGEEE